ncbi:MAG: hydroxymethylbilane synthase [Flavitalea sp.]
MSAPIRIGTRESRLAVWQATLVQQKLLAAGHYSELVYIKSEGDIDTSTPLYEMGVQGIFTKTLDIALLQKRIDIAVHSMKDVPTQLAEGIVQAAVLERGEVNDLLVIKKQRSFLNDRNGTADIATSSIRRRAQWLHKFPNHRMHNLRGNMQTRLQKLYTENWDAAIFAQAGLERIELRPDNSVILDWMLPAPAQGAIMIVARKNENDILDTCKKLNDSNTAIGTKIERDFLRGLLGGCFTPVSALAIVTGNEIIFKGNIFSPDGTKKVEIEKKINIGESDDFGFRAAKEVLANGGLEINRMIKEQLKVPLAG